MELPNNEAARQNLYSYDLIDVWGPIEQDVFRFEEESTGGFCIIYGFGCAHC